MSLVYLDTETTGLDAARHSVWEIAYAIEEGPILSSFVGHSLHSADPIALEIGRYYSRVPTVAFQGNKKSLDYEAELRTRLTGCTIVGANPAFDAKMLEARWGGLAPWHYRLLDIESYAMPYFGWSKPKGMKDIYDRLKNEGFDIPEPDHSAGGDVATLRRAHQILQSRYWELLVTAP